MTSNKGGSGSDRRYNDNMQGILKFAIENTKAEDAPGESSFAEMDPERKAWLAEALASMTKNPVKEMIKILEEITKSIHIDDDDSIMDIVCLRLDELADYCHDIDLSTDFFKVGGASILLPSLNHSNSEIRWRACELIANLAQNNPYCQVAILESRLLVPLLNLARTDSSDVVGSKALYALSGLTRDCDEAMQSFYDNDGLSVLLRSMLGDYERSRIKAAVMLQTVCNQHPQAKEAAGKMGLVEQLIGLLQQKPNSSVDEHLLNALLYLVTDSDDNLETCRQDHLRFKDFLNERIAMAKGKPECEEELDYCQQLFKLCFHSGTGQSKELGTDR